MDFTVLVIQTFFGLKARLPSGVVMFISLWIIKLHITVLYNNLCTYFKQVIS